MSKQSTAGILLEFAWVAFSSRLVVLFAVGVGATALVSDDNSTRAHRAFRSATFLGLLAAVLVGVIWERLYPSQETPAGRKRK